MKLHLLGFHLCLQVVSKQHFTTSSNLEGVEALYKEEVQSTSVSHAPKAGKTALKLLCTKLCLFRAWSKTQDEMLLLVSRRCNVRACTPYHFILGRQIRSTIAKERWLLVNLHNKNMQSQPPKLQKLPLQRGNSRPRKRAVLDQYKGNKPSKRAVLPPNGGKNRLFKHVVLSSNGFEVTSQRGHRYPQSQGAMFHKTCSVMPKRG